MDGVENPVQRRAPKDLSMTASLATNQDHTPVGRKKQTCHSAPSWVLATNVRLGSRGAKHA
jgi:hypothetical protein